jgi:hypothetical protein
MIAGVPNFARLRKARAPEEWTATVRATTTPQLRCSLARSAVAIRCEIVN